ncbi:RsiV family protein [Acinetobacter bouvetii]
MNQQWLWAVPVSCAALLMTACQERPASKTEQAAAATQEKSEAIPLIQAKVVPVKLSKPEACDAEGCTQYEIQTVNSNLKWIDDYFMDRVKKADPIAFSSAPNEKINTAEGASPDLSQSSTYIRFVSQQYDRATFAIQTYTYSSGAAHGMYHQEFVNFDLKNKKRLALQDIVVKGAEQQLLNALYDSNSLWLDQHSVERSKLQLSDNFYYGANGIVFVYPLYELASYAEGMTELTLPYSSLTKLIKAEYLPSLPKYPNS